MTYSRSELRKLLSHPDAFVRCYADWTREYRGWGWRNMPAYHIHNQEHVAGEYEHQLAVRLQRLADLGLTSSDQRHI